jgi:DNA polymerase-2
VPVRGFILHPTYRVEGGRPVVRLYGRLETGEPFLVRDDRLAPYFFVRVADAARARELGAVRQAATDLRTLGGEPVVRVEVASPADVRPLRDALVRAAVPPYEADVRFATRFLIDRGIRGAVAIAGGGGGAARGVGRVFENPDLAEADWEPPAGLLRVVSLDLETDPRAERIFSAALSGGGADEVLLARPEAGVRAGGARGGLEEDLGARVVACGDERGLLIALGARLRDLDFDLLTGWNVIDFDLAVLLAAARRLGVRFEVGRGPGGPRLIRDTSFRGRSRAEIEGRVVLDGIDLLKGAFVRLEDYRLETAARAILGEGKAALASPPEEASGAVAAAPGSGAPPGVPVAAGARAPRRGAEAIERAFQEDLPRFVRYNLTDARLVLRILEKARLVDLAVRRSRLTGMPLDRVGASIASFDFLYLSRLRRRGRVAPTVGSEGESQGGALEPTAGGAVLDPAPGLYGNVLAFDFKSLYPSLIRTFNIDPLGLVHDPPPDGTGDLIRAPNGACFRREPGILPGLLEELFPQREEARRRGDAIGAHAIKILMNSFYGVLATPACRFYSSAVANAITHFGQWALHWARDRVEETGRRVLYGDTDSLFVLAGPRGPDGAEEALRAGPALCASVNGRLREQIRATWRVESRLELEFEALFLKFFLPSIRHGDGGARKRYAGLLSPRAPGAPPEIVFVGMEAVRRDWTDLSKAFQRGLFERLFLGTTPEAASAYIAEFVRDLRAGRHDAHLIYRKSLRKGLDEYTATTPPHVRAARLLGGGARGVIEYVMTTAGPEPAAARRSPLDYRHYVDRQLRPIAEQVLPHLGVSFDQALGEGRQMTLF